MHLNLKTFKLFSKLNYYRNTYINSLFKYLKMQTIKLYLKGETPQGKEIVNKLQETVDSQLKDEYKLEVVYIVEQSVPSFEANMSVNLEDPKIPTVLKDLINDLLNKEKLLVGLTIDS